MIHIPHPVEEPRTGISHSLLLIHVSSECDSTSRFYGIEKISNMSNYHDLHELSEMFMTTAGSCKDIEEAGGQAMATIYGCKYGMDIYSECASKFMDVWLLSFRAS